jgi:hypothetical protein
MKEFVIKFFKDNQIIEEDNCIDQIVKNTLHMSDGYVIITTHVNNNRYLTHRTTAIITVYDKQHVNVKCKYWFNVRMIKRKLLIEELLIEDII